MPSATRQRTISAADSPPGVQSRQLLLPCAHRGGGQFAAREFDGLQATFRGGRTEPLHNWFPFIEGYSPEFVIQALREHAPTASHIVDPFAGTGTTPLTVARVGRRASYCELNPLLQFLIDAKVKALTVSDKRRRQTASELDSLALELPERVRESYPDAALERAYQSAFGPSLFFESETYRQVLALRTLIDETGCTNPLVAALATVAALSSLVPASKLVRRGDLRFMNAVEQARVRPNLRSLLADRLRLIATDLRRVAPLAERPSLACSDARLLRKIPCLDADAIVTSPPYLNGTNYFRNTKLELWFLRCLLCPEDLTAYRARAVTAGINDVTNGKPSEPASRNVEQLVRRLEASAYDRRIARMVQTYFHDMSEIFESLRGHLRQGAAVLIDIGDSIYAGVPVPTPRLLSEILADRGYDLRHEVVLRGRTSRDGSPLRQVLLVLRTVARRSLAEPLRVSRTWTDAWKRFKRSLPHQSGQFAKRNWGHPLHSLCSYQGKMKPSLASHLVRTFVPEGGRMLDPFGGVGTLAFEAALQGARAWSFDISPAAVRIAAAKLQPASSDHCRRVIDDLKSFLASAVPTAAELDESKRLRFNGPLADYFHPRTLSEVLLARRFFQTRPPQTTAECLVFSCLLHILHGNRPYALSRRSHPITPFAPTGRAEYRSLVEHLGAKVRRSRATLLPEVFVPGSSVFQDATATWPLDVDQVDAVITSPPFYDSTRFYLANWMRLWFSGWSADDFKRRPLAFVDERQKQDFAVYEPVFRQARERLKSGGVLILHLGKSRKCDMARELAAIARRWFRVADIFAESVRHCESHGIRDKGTVVEHTYLVAD